MSKYSRLFIQGQPEGDDMAGRDLLSPRMRRDEVLAGSLPPVSSVQVPATLDGTRKGRRLEHRRAGCHSENSDLSLPEASSSAGPTVMAADSEEKLSDTLRSPSSSNCDSEPSGSEDVEAIEELNDDRMQKMGSGHTRLFSCDACPHRVFTSHEELYQHAVEQHRELLPDYEKLHQVASKLLQVWAQVIEMRRDKISGWGRKVFSIATKRDAGMHKMAEAHCARAQLELVVQRWRPKAKVYVFGSSVAFGVWDGISDIDFTVVDVEAMESGTWPPPERNAVRSITELLRRSGFSYMNLEPISHARVPIIKHHASSPIHLHRPQCSSYDSMTQSATEDQTRLEAEDVVSRSVRYTLNAPATREDRVTLEGSIRDAVGAECVQQVWWNRTGDMMSLTCDTTTSAIKAATCGLSFVTPSLRARVQPLHEECRPELYNMDFDLSFRAFGIRNSQLLRRYLLSHPCARPGAIVLKDWSKTSGVNNSVNGYLTSYAINILWIYYLVQKEFVPYVDPVDDVPASLLHYTQYDPEYHPIVDPMWTPEQLAAYHDEAGDLLVGFFKFYAFEFDWERNVVSLNRREITTKQSIGWDVEDVGSLSLSNVPGSAVTSTSGAPRRQNTTRYELCIEDPYEENLNLGRHMGVTKTLRVKSEFYRGLLSLLKDGEKESCVFASTDMVEERSASLLSGDEGEQVSGLRSIGKLPLKVLYTLMAVTLKEIDARRRAATAAVTSDADVCSSHTMLPVVIGVPEHELRQAFHEQAPLEFRLASKAWNWQQLVHRLGFKIHRGIIVQRREVGVRRLPAPKGVVSSRVATGIPAKCATPFPTVSPERAGTPVAMAMGPDSPAEAIADETAHLRGDLRIMGLTEQMMRTISDGFLRLTPEWVSWSRPWAALHVRGHAYFTPASSCTSVQTLHPSDSGSSSSSGESSVGLLKGTQRKAAPHWIGGGDGARGGMALRMVRLFLHK